MKQFKKIDCIVQLVLLVAGVAWNLPALRNRSFLGNTPFIGSYFTLGGWQVLSAIVHMVQPFIQ
jgi:hypothetical protein